MGDFDRLKKNIFILNFHLHKKDGANMIQNFIQNNHGVSTVNHVTHGHINAGKNDILDPEPFIDSYTEPAAKSYEKASKEEFDHFVEVNFDPITRSMLEDFPNLPYKKQLKVLTYVEEIKLED